MEFVGQWAMATWQVLLEAGPWLVAGFFGAGLIHVFLPAATVVKHLGKPGLTGVWKAALLGAPLPLCSCSVIPVASAIRRQGASRGATASFLISTPETGVDSIALSYALLGPVLAIVRPIAALVTAFVAGALINPFGGAPETPETPAPPSPPAGGGSCCHAKKAVAAEAAVVAPRRSFSATLAETVRYGFGDMFANLAHWLVLGFVLSGLVSALFPPDFLERTIGAGWGAMLLMLVIGLPLYVCATASTPLAAALIAKGLSPGAALVFLLVGPATNVATMLIMGRDLGRRSLVIYLLSIGVVALAFGVATNRLWGALPVGSGLPEHNHAVPTAVAWTGALLLIVLMLNGLRLRWLRRPAMHAEGTPAQAAPSCCKTH
ncbi:MAG: SO_0444 family Cu/Zn efflux transporter [Phycisphaerae bacterium]|jgi:uncharacterized membrane protein YraQ (UPF0718 family)